jgi:hypothetical protein
MLWPLWGCFAAAPPPSYPSSGPGPALAFALTCLALSLPSLQQVGHRYESGHTPVPYCQVDPTLVLLACSRGPAAAHPAVPAGLQAFKSQLGEFLEPMFRGLVCGSRSCEVAAGQCIGRLRDLIGGCWGI